MGPLGGVALNRRPKKSQPSVARSCSACCAKTGYILYLLSPLCRTPPAEPRLYGGGLLNLFLAQRLAKFNLSAVGANPTSRHLACRQVYGDVQSMETCTFLGMFSANIFSKQTRKQ